MMAMPDSGDDGRVDGGGPSARPARAKKRLGTVVLVVVVLAIFVAGAFIVLGPTLDRIDVRWVGCEVYSAKPVISGGKTAQYAVEIPSSCGRVWLSDGVTRADAATVARRFEAGRQYEFEFGWLSRVYMHLGISSPNAHGWRRAG